MKARLFILICICQSVLLCCGQEDTTDKKKEATSKENHTNKQPNVGGKCEGCEALYEYGHRKLTPTDTLPKFAQSQPKIRLSGIVYDKNSRPTEGVILYIYHANRVGIYEKKGDEKGWGKRHGYIRGWVKTDKDGKYTFYTFRPASYPSRTTPEHIHLTVKEPHLNPYYLDDYFFDDDPLLTPSIRKEQKDRGGSGIVSLVDKGNIAIAVRDIYLGRNIPDYE